MLKTTEKLKLFIRLRVNILNTGPGVGGHCIAVDPWFLDGLDIVVIMVKHNEIAENEHRLRGKLVLDTVHICRKIEIYSL